LDFLVFIRRPQGSEDFVHVLDRRANRRFVESNAGPVVCILATSTQATDGLSNATTTDDVDRAQPIPHKCGKIAVVWIFEATKRTKTIIDQGRRDG